MMSTKETELQNVDIMPKNGDVGIHFEATLLLQYFDSDGSQIYVLKTPRRKSVDEFLTNELTWKNNEDKIQEK